MRSTIVVLSLAALLVLLVALCLLDLGSENGGLLSSLLLCGIALLQSFLNCGLSLLLGELRLGLSSLGLFLLLGLLLLFAFTCSCCTLLELLYLGLALDFSLCNNGSYSTEQCLELLKFALFLLFL